MEKSYKDEILALIPLRAHKEATGGDSDDLIDKIFESEKMGKFDFPKHVEIDISGVKYLELILDDGGDGINNDHADWLNPVLYP